MSKKRTTVYTPVETKYDIGDYVGIENGIIGTIVAIKALWTSKDKVEVSYILHGGPAAYKAKNIKGRLVYEN